MTSSEVARNIADALSKQLPEAEIVQCPLADGGEGTAETLAPYLSDDICLIESAQFVGLNLPEIRSLDVMNRGSNPLGDAMRAGLDTGKRKFVIGLGGSATNDCGLGMLMVLGMQAFDAVGDQVSSNLAGLLAVNRIDASGLDSRLSESRLTVLSDVVSPLCGKNGATAIYGPQKGVREGDVAAIDAAIERFAALCEKPELMDISGAGAAGGLGFALMLVGGEMVSGAEFVMDAMELSSKLSGADWVMTGEGRSDAQTLQGKLPLKVAQAARSAGAKVALVSGSVDQGALSHLEQEFDLVISAKPDGMDVEQAMGQAESLLAKAVRTICGNSSLRS